MCGIAGVISWSPKYRVTRDLLRAMSAKIAHRGPDGEGIFLTRENGEIDEHRPQAGLAFRRLAILDPDPRAMQPFTIGSQTLVFNGEIYNFRELRAELTKLRPDYSWRTAGDTEVLLLSYATWGERCLEKLNGMFAFAVWDNAQNEIFLARDRMGQKPLYYTLGPDCLAFASELSALIYSPNWTDRNHLDGESLVHYLRLGYVGADRTIYSGVRNLLPSTWIKGNQSRFQHQYFHRIAPAAHGPANDTRDVVQRAVQRQLVSDVPLGIFLSGGIDSSVVAACASKAGPIQTFSIGFDDPRYDETEFSARVAAHLGTRHHSFRVTPAVVEDLPRLAAVFGEPFADSSAIPTHYLARETRQHVKVALSGDGGDELFGGYDRYRAMRLTDRFPAGIRTAMAWGGELLPDRHPKSSIAKLRRLLRSSELSAGERYEEYVALFSYEDIDALRGRRWTDEGWAEDFETLANEFDSYRRHYQLDVVRAAMSTDLTGYLPNDLLTKVDRASMLHALEVRSPFMDHELVQFAAGLTTDQLLKGGPKRMLREAFAADLPDFVFKRKKMGFAVPIGDWLRKELRSMLHDNLFSTDSFAAAHFNLAVVRRLVDEHESFRVDHSQRLYALLMLELWHREFNRGNR